MQRTRGGDLFLTGIDETLFQLFTDSGLVEELGEARFTLKTETTKESERFYALFGNLNSSSKCNPTRL